MNQPKVVRSQAGVELKKISLVQGTAVLHESFTVSSQRTPEVKNFGSDAAAAEKYFSEEVARCS